MILVTLGTQDRPFTRLLDAVQSQIEQGNIKDRVVVQAGHTPYQSKDMEIFDLIPLDEFDQLMKEADLIITHGGVASIVTGMKNHKKVIAAARLAKYGEHTNDHQLQILENLSQDGYILVLEDFDKLNEVLVKSKTFQPKTYKSNTKKMIKIIEDFINK